MNSSLRSVVKMQVVLPSTILIVRVLNSIVSNVRHVLQVMPFLRSARTEKLQITTASTLSMSTFPIGYKATTYHLLFCQTATFVKSFTMVFIFLSSSLSGAPRPQINGHHPKSAKGRPQSHLLKSLVRCISDQSACSAPTSPCTLYRTTMLAQRLHCRQQKSLAPSFSLITMREDLRRPFGGFCAAACCLPSTWLSLQHQPHHHRARLFGLWNDIHPWRPAYFDK